MTSPRRPLLEFCSAVLVTLWAGSLWTVCFIVAPQLFARLPDRHWAGQMAGSLFDIETWLGLGAAILLIAMLAARKVLAGRKALLWSILVTAGAPLASKIVLSPMMAAARAANDMKQFGMLHGVSAVLFFTACVSAAVLVWQQTKLNHPAE